MIIVGRDAYLVLNRISGFGSAALRRLLAVVEDLDQIFTASVTNLRKAGLTDELIAQIRSPDQEALAKDLAWLEQPDCSLITLSDPDYPAQLKQISSPPLVLFCRGRRELLSVPQLAMVGSRNASAGGKQNAADFARALAEAGIAITSGLALGIDAAAHTGALAGRGTTIAVMATGPDRVYPAANRDLIYQIAESGVVLTEFPVGVRPMAPNFPRRNRIISGLSLGTLVVEAAVKSGTLVTAKYAYEQGREVFAIPGSIHNPLARGCHQLIKQGAKLVESVEDILSELAPQLQSWLRSSKSEAFSPEPQQDMDELEIKLWDALGFDPVSVDQLLERTGLTAERICSMLVLMEIDGRATSGSGGTWQRSVQAIR